MLTPDLWAPLQWRLRVLHHDVQPLPLEGLNQIFQVRLAASLQLSGLASACLAAHRCFISAVLSSCSLPVCNAHMPRVWHRRAYADQVAGKSERSCLE